MCDLQRAVALVAGADACEVEYGYRSAIAEGATHMRSSSLREPARAVDRLDGGDLPVRHAPGTATSNDAGTARGSGGLASLVVLAVGSALCLNTALTATAPDPRSRPR